MPMINADLTKEEAKFEYDERVARRNRRQPKSGSATNSSASQMMIDDQCLTGTTSAVLANLSLQTSSQSDRISHSDHITLSASAGVFIPQASSSSVPTNSGVATLARNQNVTLITTPSTASHPLVNCICMPPSLNHTNLVLSGDAT